MRIARLIGCACAALVFIVVSAGLAVEPGPRGVAGPDVPLDAQEAKALEARQTVQGQTAAAVQQACQAAAKQGGGVVFLPAGQYTFETTVRVPGGVTILGEGAKTHIHTKDKQTKLFLVEGDRVRFTRLKLEGALATTSQENDTFGISCMGGKDVRIDHCELTGFSYATNFANEATAQVDRCFIHHNLRDGLGYGVAVYSGAYVLVIDNEFSQNRHSLASNGSLDWSSPKKVGKYVHKPGVRKTHWEFVHNRVKGDDLTTYQLCVVDTHPGMDGTFVVEQNIFEDLRHGVGIRDGSGVIRGNVFRRLHGDKGRTAIGISIAYGTHNNIPVEGTMPREIIVADNQFVDVPAERFKQYEVGKAQNITIDGKVVESTRSADAAGVPGRLRLQEMDKAGVLKWSRE